jgi:hypothetical protein
MYNMRTLGLLIVVGALAYYYGMLPPSLPSAPKGASAQSIQQEAKENKEETVEEENGDHLFPADLTS